MMLRILFLAAIAVCLFVILGCSGSPTDPASSQPALYSPNPSLMSGQGIETSGNRYLWGYWNFRWNSEIERFEATPLRTSELHLNVLKFLEYSMCQICLSIGANEWNEDGDLEVEIHINHPVTEDGVWDKEAFSGFDVRGIVIFGGTYYFNEHGFLVSSYERNEFTLVDADGYTRLFSPAAFPPGSLGRDIFEYFPAKYEVNGVNLPTTLNPYRAFYTMAERRCFEAGKNDTRTFTLRFPPDPSTAPLEFGYAVDASYARPSKKTGVEVPGDFPPGANSIEPYRIDADFDGYLTPDTGQFFVLIRVYDWQGLNTIADDGVWLEAPDLFNGRVQAAVGTTQPQYKEFTATIYNSLNALVGEYPVLISSSDIYTVPIIGKVDAYNIFMVPVSPPLNLETTVTGFGNFPIQGIYNPNDTTCYFCPVPLEPSMTILGIDETFLTVSGFPKNMTAYGGMGLCIGSQEIYLATDSGGLNDISVYNINNKAFKWGIDVPSLIGNPGTGPLHFAVHETMQQVWVSLYFENQVAVFFSGIPSPDITRVDVGTGPATLALDDTNYRVFAACEWNDTVAIIDGWHISDPIETISLQTPIVAPDASFPATPGMAYVPGNDYLYITTLQSGGIDYYDLGNNNTYMGSIQLATAGAEVIMGLKYDPYFGVLIATGHVGSGFGHVWMIDPDTNTEIYEVESSGRNPSFPGLDSANHRLFVPDPADLVDIYQIVN